MPVLGESFTGGWRRPRDHRPVPTGVEVAIAATAAFVLGPVVGMLQREAMARGHALFGIAVALSVLAAVGVAVSLHRRLAGGVPWHALVVGAVAGLVAGTAWANITAGVGLVMALAPNLPVLGALTLALTVAAVRTTGGYAVAARVTATLSALLVIAPAVRAVDYFFDVASPAPSAMVDDPAASVPEPIPGPPVDQPSPTLGDLCHPDEITTEAVPPQRAMSRRVAELVATNTGSRTCTVAGYPTIELLGGADQVGLALAVRATPVDIATGQTLTEETITLEPGQKARTAVWWLPWGSAADTENPQELRIGVGGGAEIIDLGPDQRWDVLRDVDAWVSPWQALSDRGQTEIIDGIDDPDTSDEASNTDES